MDGNFRLAPVLIGLVVIGGLLVYGCREGPFGRRQYVTMSPEQEARLGAQAFQQIMRQERANVLPDSSPIVERVRHVGLRLARASEEPALRKRMKLPNLTFRWDFEVVRSKQVNAFCLPGGKVVVYTGILPVCRTDAGLATVMGHEIGHALARHGAERVSQSQLVQVGQIAAAVSIRDLDPRTQAAVIGLLGAATEVGVTLPFSRSHESEADHIGLFLMAAAGYDPSEAIEFWRRMDRQGGGRRPPEFLSTHPSHGTRIQQLKKWLPEAQEIYRTSTPQKERLLPLPG
jgi:metalloendopeptidase OMA1, mitochondrial